MPLMMVLLIVAVDCVVKLSPVVLILSVAIHVYVEPMLLVKGIVTVFPVHIVALLALVITGVGLTVTVIVCAVPTQLPPVDVGVTVYITLCTLDVVFVIASFNVLVDCSAILSPVVLGLLAAIHV